MLPCATALTRRAAKIFTRLLTSDSRDATWRAALQHEYRARPRREYRMPDDTPVTRSCDGSGFPTQRPADISSSRPRSGTHALVRSGGARAGDGPQLSRRLQPAAQRRSGLVSRARRGGHHLLARPAGGAGCARRCRTRRWRCPRRRCCAWCAAMRCAGMVSHAGDGPFPAAAPARLRPGDPARQPSHRRGGSGMRGGAR